jgi:drug/metabolite transporter (DMT)-like permease
MGVFEMNWLRNAGYVLIFLIMWSTIDLLMQVVPQFTPNDPVARGAASLTVAALFVLSLRLIVGAKKK